MVESILGEIRMFAGNFAPAGWALCDGQLLPIAENDALFSLLGNTYGGDAVETFALPDLRGRIPIHRDPRHPVGQKGGVEEVRLTLDDFPAHSHQLLATRAPASRTSPAQSVPGRSRVALFAPPGKENMALMARAAVGTAGGGRAHPNLQPFLCLNFIIALAGIFPRS